ncbi:MAG: transposase [Geitlerinemataceae cyanobacterium]
MSAQKEGKLFAPLLFESSCNTALFETWVEDYLCPQLTAKSLVLMDDAAFHKSSASRAAIEATGATLLFVAPYSPDLNPIENTFGVMKRHRSHRPQLSLDGLVRAFC